MGGRHTVAAAMVGIVAILSRSVVVLGGVIIIGRVGIVVIIVASRVCWVGWGSNRSRGERIQVRSIAR